MLAEIFRHHQLYFIFRVVFFSRTSFSLCKGRDVVHIPLRSLPVRDKRRGADRGKSNE